MGQTLTHGIYLPDEGERNCYSGLAANWQLLDGAVGTVAEHSTQIAGKAPLVHTHTKSDITDLFNSANTWSGDNTYSKPVAIERNTDTGNFLALKNTVAEMGSTPASATPVTIAYRDKNDENLGYMGVYYDTDGSNLFRLYVRNKFTSGSPSTSGTADYAYFAVKINADKSKEGVLRGTFRPYDNNTYDLGSSTYQWNNLYANKVNTQSVNGINPGALSLPSGNGSEAITVDITDWYIQDPDYPDDPTKKILDATNHKVDTAVPGWLHIIFPNVAGNWAYARKYAAGVNMALQRIADGVASSDFANVELIFPIYSSCYVRIKAKTATVRIFPCLGNV